MEENKTNQGISNLKLNPSALMMMITEINHSPYRNKKIE